MKTAILSLRDDVYGHYREERSGLAFDWTDWMKSLDIQPVTFPNGSRPPEALLEKIDPMVLVLTGGNDVIAADPNRSSPRREETEDWLIEWALKVGTPIFGVCRGMHKLNHYFGGHVRGKLAPENGEHVAATHEVRLLGKFINWAQSKSLTVNSFHDQGFFQEDLASEFTLGALDVHGVVEGMYHETRPIVAVQWHPEREAGASQFCADVLAHLSQRAPRDHPERGN